jgi:peptide deformylase
MKASIVQSNDPVLRKKAAPVPRKDITSAKIRAVIAAMKKALAPEENGVAIAAPQIGEPLRIFVVSGKIFNTEEDGEKNIPDLVFINPELIRTSRKKWEVSEGCLSVRDVYGSVLRYEKVSVRALGERGELFTYHGSGLLAQIFQHEMDHLEGVLFIDKALSIEEPEKLKSKSVRRSSTVRKNKNV